MPEGTMRALWYNKPQDFEIKQVPIPKVGDDDCSLESIMLRSVVGTPRHLERTLILSAQVYAAQTDTSMTGSSYPSSQSVPLISSDLIPGHEAIGKVVEMGKNVKGFEIGDRCVADVGLTNQPACAIHGLDKLNPPVGIEVLLLGAGPTGLILAQLLKLNGASRVVIAANKGIKMDIARQLEAGDEYIELDRQNPDAQWQKLKDDNPYGFDVVVEATGVEKDREYVDWALVHWPPSKIFGDEITIIGSFSQTYCFPRAVAYLDSGKVKVKGMVTDVFKLEDYQLALDKMNSRGALKIAIKP
ncbi:hypothetical protein BD769DRAFT_1676101 [Suillus cothurnatus]|nr:hypothetical protein BD769DRAFT_1676101 [Suillus cothurnatus]